MKCLLFSFVIQFCIYIYFLNCSYLLPFLCLEKKNNPIHLLPWQEHLSTSALFYALAPPSYFVFWAEALTLTLCIIPMKLVKAALILNLILLKQLWFFCSSCASTFEVLSPFICFTDDQSMFSLVKALTPEENPVFVYILVSKVIYVQKCQKCKLWYKCSLF